MAEYDFSGKVAFISGGARGQGREHARLYARNGADVVVGDICENIGSNPYELGTREELEETVSIVEDEGQEALAVEMDVRNEDDVEAAVDAALEEFGRIDFLANNAGIFTASEVTEMSEEMWDDMLDVNLKGVWLCSKHVGKHMIERGSGGKIISTASVAGEVGFEFCGHYVAAKHGVAGLTKTLALELAEYDINVNAVAPSSVDTPMIDGFVEAYGEEMIESMVETTGPMNVFTPEDGQYGPEEISKAYMWLSSKDAKYVTGTTLDVDTGHTAK